MLHPASGTGVFAANAIKSIRLHRHGCSNRPFFHIVVTEKRKTFHEAVIEQLGTYDPLPNEYNEKLVSLNMERIRHWLGNGAKVSKPAAQVLGLSGFLPIHPTSYIAAWRIRKAAEDAEKEAEHKTTAESTKDSAKN